MDNKKKIIFLGSKKVGEVCLDHMVKKQEDLNFSICGVLTNKRGAGVLEICKRNKIRVLDGLSEYLAIDDVDIAISVQYHEILKPVHIEKAKEITINVHMAPLPEYRGCNQFSFAIINGDKEFGTTIHKLEKGVDSGAVLFEERFEIPDDIWVNELYDITFEYTVDMFTKSLPKIVSGDYTFTDQKDLMQKRKSSVHFRSEIETIKNIDLSWGKEKIGRYIRATSMPGFPPPYTMINGVKINLEKAQK